MFSFHSLHPASPSACSSLRRNFARSVFALLVMFCLSAALLFTGCSTDPDDFYDDHTLDTRLIGTWESSYGDGYTITKSGSEITLTYSFTDPEYGEFINYAGIVVYVSNFSSNAGVIIIEYDSDKKPEYQDYDDNWNPVGGPYPPPGDYLGIYYKDLKTTSVQMGGAFVAGGAEEVTPYDAAVAFTLENEKDYMGQYGAYTKQ